MKLVSDERIAELAEHSLAAVRALQMEALRAAIQETAEACAKVCEESGAHSAGAMYAEMIRRRAQGE